MSKILGGLDNPVTVGQGGTGATTAPTALTNLGAVPLAGGTMTGYLILNADPVSALGATTKQYVDAIAAGFDIKAPCYAASTADVNATYLNGAAGIGATLTNAGALAAFSIDGVSPALNARILIKDQATTFENGIYTLTTVGSGAVAWILTRATDYDESVEIFPGNFILITDGTVNAGTAWVEVDTVTNIGVDPITFTEFGSTNFATKELDNLSAVAINTSLISDTDITDNLGSPSLRWNNAYLANIETGDTAADTLTISAWDVDGATSVPFITLTANNTPTCTLAGSVTGVTQSSSDNSTKLATTAYVDAQVPISGANKALSNLASVAINTALLSASDNTLEFGAQNNRWSNVYATNYQTGHTIGNTYTFSAWDVDGATSVPFITFTAANTPTCALSGSVTGVTQSASDNSTKLATTAYVDAQVTTAGANTALSNLASVAINTTLVSDTDVTDNLGSQAIRWNNIYAATVQSGDTAADTLQIGAWDVDGAAFVPFLTLTSNNTPTGVLASSVTGTTQSANDNSTKLATTAYVDASTASGGRLKSVQVFSTPGTPTWTKPAGINSVVVECLSAGGGGGFVNAGASGAGAGAGGGSGAYGKAYIDVSAISSETVTVGSGGTGGVGSTSTAAGTGGTTSFGSHISATGGVGGTGMTRTAGSASAGGGAGGACTGGLMTTAGAVGDIGLVQGGVLENYGQGAPSIYGGGATAQRSDANGTNGTGFGGGGSGGTSSTTSRNGGDGSPGIVIVWEYS